MVAGNLFYQVLDILGESGPDNISLLFFSPYIVNQVGRFKGKRKSLLRGRFLKGQLNTVIIKKALFMEPPKEPVPFTKKSAAINLR